ncbi:glycerol acyltransferase [Alsobacter metallidurans]|uniref:Glycerol acyltransferase n=1 Tax=Alsobacter metallidurans TaxID=340221 RepID=A0A917MH70_9HYPH|nr:lysophospholipid acyltransferase family protein [Alsobacter metallidurans]GGH15957.1 glycerol acyltransferase [Alsobacter metallidurans]
MDDLLFSYADETTPRFKRRVIRTVERLTGQPKLKRIYVDNQLRPRAGESFWSAAVRRLRLDVRFDAARLAALPKTGPLVIVANHPYGVLDGLVIAWLAERIRPDFKILTHAVLLRAPEAAPQLLPVDFSGSPTTMATNLASRAAARDHLAQGGCVVVFPAGGVSTSPDRLGRKPAQDAPWQPFTAQLIEKAKAAVVPMYFEGQNSRVFQIASHLSLTLRLALIFHEVRSRMGAELRVAIGAPIDPSELAQAGDRRAQMADLRRRTEALASDLPARCSPERRGVALKSRIATVSAKLSLGLKRD